MPIVMRANPETTCQPDGAHHPHLMICSDYPDCDCWQYTDDGMPYSRLECHVCGQNWPCETKRRHVAHRLLGT